MGLIQAGVGLASGINYTSIVSQLMQVAATSRNNLMAQTNTLTNQQTALTQLTALLASMEYVTDNLGNATTVFQDQNISSSNSAALTATATGTPSSGTYQFTPLQMAQSEQWIGSGLASANTALGGGNVTFRYGAGVDNSPSLSVINGGQGFVPGQIRITDRSGASALVDLSNAQSLSQVVTDINGTQGINVTASIQGDHLQLTDNTGKTASNLEVQEVGSGTTAASLGLAGIDAAAATAAGASLTKLTTSTPLAALNDGNGLELNTVVPDIGYSLANGQSGTIDLAPIENDSSTVDEPTTLGDVLNEINAAAPGELQASIDPTGTHLVVKDLTTGNGTFSLSSLTGSNALYDLGLNGNATGNTVTGRQIMGGLNSVLLSSLNGGQGYGTLGNVTLTSRAGNSATIDLSGAQTLQDVIGDINAADVGVTAAVNAADDGIQLTDTTGSSTGNLVVANADGTDTASKLGIALDAAANSDDSGDMHLKVVSMNTALSALNGGAGVAQGTVSFTDSTGKTATLNLTQSGFNTVGDVVRAINRLGIGVQASLNGAGDGILVQDTAGGTGPLSVQEGNASTAADLHLLGGTQSVTVNGKSVQEVNGSTTQTIQLASTDTLQDLVNKINAADAGLSASIFNDGSATPNRLTLTSTQAGLAGRMVVDTSGVGITLNPTVQAQNAVLVVGGSNAANGIVATSSNNVFTGVLPGASLTIAQATGQPVSISVNSSADTLITNLQTMVSDYNSFQSQLGNDTSYDTTTNTGSVLTGDPTAIDLDTQLSQTLSQSFGTSSTINSLADVGLTFGSDGTLSLDTSTLQSVFDSDPSALQQFFTQAKTGFSAQMHNLLESLAGANNSLLTNRVSALGNTVTADQTRITEMNSQLNQQQQDLLQQFYGMETAISQMQSNLQVINNLDILDPGSASSSSSSSSSSTTTPSTMSNLSSIG